MHRFWEGFLLPIAEGCRAKVLCEVGSLEGRLTRKILDYCVAVGGVAHVIDPLPKFDVAGWEEEYGETMVFHRAPSLEVLGEIPVPDFVLIDGDHNWYTVINELRTLDRHARDNEATLPVIALHDVGWP